MVNLISATFCMFVVRMRDFTIHKGEVLQKAKRKCA